MSDIPVPVLVAVDGGSLPTSTPTSTPTITPSPIFRAQNFFASTATPNTSAELSTITPVRSDLVVDVFTALIIFYVFQAFFACIHAGKMKSFSLVRTLGWTDFWEFLMLAAVLPIFLALVSETGVTINLDPNHIDVAATVLLYRLCVVTITVLITLELSYLGRAKEFWSSMLVISAALDFVTLIILSTVIGAPPWRLSPNANQVGFMVVTAAAAFISSFLVLLFTRAHFGSSRTEPNAG